MLCEPKHHSLKQEHRIMNNSSMDMMNGFQKQSTKSLKKKNMSMRKFKYETMDHAQKFSNRSVKQAAKAPMDSMNGMKRHKH